MKQTWLDLLFAHWPIPLAQMRPLVPAQLALDTFTGQCWIGIVPFRMSGIRARFLPPIPGLSALPELNVRTYVTHGGKPGVYFFSLDAASRPAVWGARTFYHLPYFHADVSTESHNGNIHYSSARRHSSAEFRGIYQPVSSVRPPASGTLEHWLTDRYCLYTIHQNQIYRCEIHHPPWPLQDAKAAIEINSLAWAAGIELRSTPPQLHFSKRQDVLIWPLRKA